MIHQFKHSLQSGEILTLSVDMSVNPPIFSARPQNLVRKHVREYGQWLHEVIVPALLDLADEERMTAFARRGLDEIAGTRETA